MWGSEEYPGFVPMLPGAANIRETEVRGIPASEAPGGEDTAVLDKVSVFSTKAKVSYITYYVCCECREMLRRSSNVRNL